jgi:GNAT superfamily N-acetyltransferase
VIVQLSPVDFDRSLDGLAGLLVDAVRSGASLGFVEPFDHAAAADWWRTRRPAVADGGLLVWAATRDGNLDGRDGDPAGGDGSLDGTISLALESKPNGRHRADVLKLMVRRSARGRGLGRELLATAEKAAADAGASLLMLDTETGSAAEFLYHSAGWTPYGLVPEYAAGPSGVLRDCTFFYKRLA